MSICRCSFCDATEHSVPRLVKGDHGAICARRVIVCVDILITDGDAKTGSGPSVDLTASGQAAAKALTREAVDA